MQFRKDPKSGNELSVLGFGCMRFPRTLGIIDFKKTEDLILEAVKNGINYFDTAYLYAGSEETLGAILHKHKLRDKVYIATKLPHGKCRSYEDFDRLFSQQLEHLQTDYIDYYLIHNLSDMAIWEKLKDMGIESWINEKKAAGKIRQLGYSFHGMQKEFIGLLDAYDWDFCQIQYNYINVHHQAGMEGLKNAAARGLPVIVMEPLLGGRLASGLPKKALHVFKNMNKERSPAAWAFRWLWNQPEITLVLSGMNGMSQLQENIADANGSRSGMFSKEENALFDAVVDVFNESCRVPCTGCNYCMPCPQKVNIPGCFAAYNMSYSVGMFHGIIQYATSTAAFSQRSYSPVLCVKCGKCEKLCPQHISIMNSLEDVKKRMEPFWFRLIRSGMTRSRAKK